MVPLKHLRLTKNLAVLDLTLFTYICINIEVNKNKQLLKPCNVDCLMRMDLTVKSLKSLEGDHVICRSGIQITSAS